MSLPSYIVNFEEFNDMLSSSLQDVTNFSLEQFKISFFEKSFFLHHTDIAKRMLFFFPAEGFVYGIKISETANRFGNKVVFGYILDGRVEELGSFFLYDGYEGIVFEKPVFLVPGVVYFIDYQNLNCISTHVNLSVRIVGRRL